VHDEEVFQEFNKKYGLDPLTSKKAVIKLEDQVAKTKKILSANSEASCGCECLMEEYDFSTSLTRADLESMCAPMKSKVVAVLEKAKAASGISVSDIDVVEICGGASRVPWVKEAISKAFRGMELSTRLNADECVARGCAQQAALLSKYYKVKDFKVLDVSPFPVNLKWDRTDLMVFPANSVLHLTKILTFFRREAFEIEARYSDLKTVLPGTPAAIGICRIELPPQREEQMVKVKAVLSSSGTFFIEGAQLLEEIGQDADGRKQYKRTDLAISPIASLGYTAAEISKCFEAEEEMRADMREIIETNARRNDLEGYILSMQTGAREDGKYGPYLPPDDREAFLSALMQAEDWLWDHIDDPKEVFIQKLAELKVWGGPAEARYTEEVRRTELVKDVFDLVRIITEKAKKMDKSVKERLNTVFGETVQWIGNRLNDQKVLAKYEDPVITCADIEEKKEMLINMAESVLKGDSEPSSPKTPKTASSPSPAASPPPSVPQAITLSQEEWTTLVAKLEEQAGLERALHLREAALAEEKDATMRAERAREAMERQLAASEAKSANLQQQYAVLEAQLKVLKSKLEKSETDKDAAVAKVSEQEHSIQDLEAELTEQAAASKREVQRACKKAARKATAQAEIAAGTRETFFPRKRARRG